MGACFKHNFCIGGNSIRMEEIKALEARLKSLEDKMDHQGDILLKVLISVGGDESLGIKGFKHHLGDLLVRIDVLEKHKEKNKRWKWLGMGAFFGAGGMVGVFGTSAMKSFMAAMIKLGLFIGGFLTIVTLVLLFI